MLSVPQISLVYEIIIFTSLLGSEKYFSFIKLQHINRKSPAKNFCQLIGSIYYMNGVHCFTV